MKATTKKHIARLDASVLEGVSLRAIDRSTGAACLATVVSVTNRVIDVVFPNGKFEPVCGRFRRDTGTQMGGSLRLELTSLLPC